MKEKKLIDLCLNITDGVHSTVIDDLKGDCYLLSCKNVKDGKIKFNNNDRFINFATLNHLRKRTKMEKGDVILTTVGTIGESSVIKDLYPKYEFQRSVAIIKPNKDLILPKYLHYFLISKKGQNQIAARIKGAAQPCLFLTDLKQIEIELSDIQTQQHIVNTIGSIDDLIENKQKIINKLIKQSTNIFRKYCNQKIIKNINLGKYCKIKTGNLNADSAVENGKYLFFTCGQKDLYINNYAFDCKAIIISGNGEISCKYYEGKFNAYQRTYVLEPERYFYLFLKQCELSVNNLKNNSQGSVIKFITKGILESISIPICQNSNVINNKLSIIYNLISKTKNEIIKLKYIKQKMLNKYF
ncbi:restriction endonuclease subunit S [Metamycoplasma hominis]|uniref:restriction endonuclease subunit S n=1 Tax=Metamycoplasma hominis TaxID=2098 RepID=UPI003CF6BDF6